MKVEHLGAGASALCAAHCAAMPLLAGASWWSANDHGHGPEYLECALLVTAAVIGFATLGTAYRRHRNPLPLLLLTAGLAMLAASHLLFPHPPPALAVVGALILVSAQLLNRTCPGRCCAAPERSAGT